MLIVPSIMHALVADLTGPPLQILRQIGSVLALVAPGNDPGRIVKEVIHLFQRQQLGFRQREPEVDGVSNVEDDEYHVEPPSDVINSGSRDLSNHGVEGK